MYMHVLSRTCGFHWRNRAGAPCSSSSITSARRPRPATHRHGNRPYSSRISAPLPRATALCPCVAAELCCRVARAPARTRAPGGVSHVSDPDESRQFASSPCYMARVLGIQECCERVKAWRGERRKRLLKQRLGVDSDTRRNLNRVIVTRLTELLDARTYPILGFYWPIRGEIDVRELARIHLRCRRTDGTARHRDQARPG